LLAGGVGAIKLQDGDQVAAFGVVAGKGALLTITAAGYAKRSPMEEFPTQGRYGQGVIAHKITDKTGPVVGAAVIARGAGPLAAVTEKGVSKPLAPRDVPEMGRNTQGKKVLSLAQGDTVRALLPLVGAGELAEEESEPSPAPRRRARAASKATTESRRTSTKAKAKASTKSAAKATSKRAQKATSKSKAKAEKKSASAKPAESKSAKAKTKKTKRDQSAAATKEKKTAQKSSRRKAEKAVDAKAQDTTSTAKEKETKRTKRRKVALVTSVPQIRQKK